LKNNGTMLIVAVMIAVCGAAHAEDVKDPGVRGGPAGAGDPLPGVPASFFRTARDQFAEVEGVAKGLGPRFNLDSCAGCHLQPAIGGSSPATNPQVAVATANGAKNTVPPFISLHGPVREARFISVLDGEGHPSDIPDGGVHDLFVITGRADAPGCKITQPDFEEALDHNNVIFRIPTPVFGLGLVQNTPDQNLIADAARLAGARAPLGIAGHFNTSGNDGTISRFGWKAQNKSLLMFAGEAYNVEMGITNELFPNEREYDPACQSNRTPENFTDITASGTVAQTAQDIVLFEKFMEELAAPVPATQTTSTVGGAKAFADLGCNLCHVPTHKTGPSNLPALSNVTFSPFSDFQLHKLGQGLQDQIGQGQAAGDEFRTAPLWGLGQRIFFLHDGRTTDLLQAIEQHASDGSEANKVIENFNRLPDPVRQDILNFLRSL
jgi:CxxC motif-containing protein (DUF1111 family)